MNIVPRPTIPPPKIGLNKLTDLEDEVSSWKKNIKISPMDYKPSRTKPAGLVSRNASLPPLNLMDSITSLT
jgi:hypothetical protein